MSGGNSRPVAGKDALEKYFKDAHDGKFAEVVSFLDLYGDKYVDAQDRFGHTALIHCCIGVAQADMAKELLKRGARVDILDNDKRDAFSHATRLGYSQELSILLMTYGADPSKELVLCEPSVDEDGDPVDGDPTKKEWYLRDIAIVAGNKMRDTGNVVAIWEKGTTLKSVTGEKQITTTLRAKKGNTP